MTCNSSSRAQARRIPMPGTLKALTTGIIAAALTGHALLAGADPAVSGISIETLSSRPNLVTGGNVLVKISYQPGMVLPLWVTLNDHDVTGKFRATQANTWTGVVEGLQLGSNTLRVRAKSSTGIRDESLQVTNYPITGPVLSGPQLQPYFCMTDQFYLPNGTYLGPPTDNNCSAPTQVQYVYKTTGGIFLPLPSTRALPADIAMTTTSDG